MAKKRVNIEENKEDVKKRLEEKLKSLRTKHKEKEEYLLKLKKSFDIEMKNIVEIEGAILALHEVLTGEKV